MAPTSSSPPPSSSGLPPPIPPNPVISNVFATTREQPPRADAIATRQSRHLLDENPSPTTNASTNAYTYASPPQPFPASTSTSSSSSGGVRGAPTPASHGQPSSPLTDDAPPLFLMGEGIEMEAMTGSSSNDNGSAAGALGAGAIGAGGHRRRRSSLLNGANGTSGHHHRSSSRSHNPWPRNPSHSPDERKISEEEDAAPETPARRDHSHEILSDEDLHDDEETGLTKQDRRRKRHARKRNTRLDNRVAMEAGITAEERKMADQTVLRRLAINGSLILLWYLFSLSISLYNKWMFDADRLNFAFPLFTTSLHMIVQFGLASLVLYIFPSLRPQATRTSDLGRSRHETEPERPIMTKLFYLTRIAPCGAATGLDIGLGNMSLLFIRLTFYTMCKSSSLAFVLIFAFLFRLETPTWRLVAIIATMTLGVIMMVAGEVEFHLTGFVLVISAAAFSGFRWSLTQILLLRNPATSNPFSSIFFLAPVMFLTLTVLAIPVEGFGPLIEGIRRLMSEWGTLMAPLVLLFPGCIAFLMTASEFALLQRTSVVTLSIAGIFKEVVTISAAAVVFQDRLTPVNAVGLVVTLAAIVAYNYIKITKMREQAAMDVRKGQLDMDLDAGPSSSSNSESDAEAEDAPGEDVGLLRGEEAERSASPQLGEEQTPGPR